MVRRARSSVAGCGIVVFVTAISVSAAELPAVANSIKRLNLGRYLSNMRPPDFSGVTANDRVMSLAGLRGRVVLLNFWASWCHECRPEMPMFEQLHREFSTRGLSVIGINFREGPAAVREYSKQLGLTFPLVLDSRGEINTAYGVIGLPTTFIIGRDGKAVALAVGPREWTSAPARALIQTLLARPQHWKGTR